jgi:hypothetical protein
MKTYTFYRDNDPKQKYTLPADELEKRFRQWIQLRAKTKAGLYYLFSFQGLRTLFLCETFLSSFDGLRSNYDESQEADLFYLLAKVKKDEFKKLV